MNPYRIVILFTLAVRYILEVGEWLSIRHPPTTLPEEVRDVYDPDKYKKSQEYTRTTTGFSLVQETFNIAILLAFWFWGGFNILDQIVRGWGLSALQTGILYIGILTIANMVISLPFQIYSTFVIEERFGFNRTTAGTFVADRLKGLALMALLGIPTLALILWFFQLAGPRAWIYCWAFTIALTMAIQFIAPVWIMPLFNKFTPLPDGELKTAILDFAKSVQFSFKDIYIVDSSKRTGKTNAYFTGFGKNKRIALFDTLVSGSTVQEIVAVLAHEIGHYKKKHILQSLFAGFVQMGFIFFLLSLFINSRPLFDAFFMKDISVYAGLLFFAMLYEPVSFLLSVILNSFSRKHELEADRYAVQTTPEREFLVSALKKMYVQNLANLQPHPLYVLLHYSHPPLLKRIAAIRAA